MNIIEKLDKEKLGILHLYMQLEKQKFGKTKKHRYEEIARRTKKSVNTIKSWIARYYVKYLACLEEIAVVEENATICNLEGLTEKQTAYVIARMNGYSTQEAKEIAGYAKSTKAADIEKHPKIQKTMIALRERLFEDTKLGAEQIANDLKEIAVLGMKGIEVIETVYHDESNGTLGRITSRNVKKKTIYNLSASQAALKEINNMLGYEYMGEIKAERKAGKLEEELLELKIEKAKKDLNKENVPKVLD